MKEKLFLLFLVSGGLTATPLMGQTRINGVVTDHRTGEPLTGVNIYVKGEYDGTTSGADGSYTLAVDGDQPFVLVFSFVGYQNREMEIAPDTHRVVNIRMKESITSLKAVTITAGSFEAGDRKRAAVMTPLDIYTTAGSMGDIGAALKTLPGTQIAADDGRLMVRGGDAGETKVLMDGMLAAKPYYSKVPDLPTRGRFAPSLFEGVFFSTGGYSAEYGQALSSVLVLESSGVALEELTSLSLMNIGGEVSKTLASGNRSFSAGMGYYNFGPFNHFAHNRIDWDQPVESGNAYLIYRHKGDHGNLFKSFVAGDYGGQSFRTNDGSGGEITIDEAGGNLYSNTTFNTPVSDKTLLKVGASITFDHQDMRAGIHNVDTKEWISEGKLKLITRAESGLKLTYGTTWQFNQFNEEYLQEGGALAQNSDVHDHLVAAFAEGEWRLSNALAFRPGIRFEHSSRTGEYHWSPRAAMAFATGENTTISMAWGHYYQAVPSDFLKYNPSIEMQKAEHFILGLQTGQLSRRLFRAEAYYKKYRRLVTGEYNQFAQFVPFANGGEGYAKGIDLFFRDKTLFDHTDYWVSYSLIVSKRKFLDYPLKVEPEFIAPHTLNVVAKHFIIPLRTQIGASWSWNSGRPYHQPGDAQFMAHTSPNYSEIGVNMSYLTGILGNQTIVHLSFSNVLGRDNVLGYRRIPLAIDDGDPKLVTIRSDVKQFVFLGVFISIN
ncbi:TonB-dependent receptor [Thermophagus sp. OGC60D27]|uniref:TonB-dependent receptor n=1 Tax=Thermophagus sp. OGC60D27 TaxID=3458415 RepID=UPI0040378969